MFFRSLVGLIFVCLSTVVAGYNYHYLTLHNTNITFAYLDSGAPYFSNDYTTLVLLHGMGFNSLVFQKIMPIAAQNNIRIIAVNRRDYAPTSLLDYSELQIMTQGDAGAQTYFQQRGNEIGLFLDQWLQHNYIPTVHHGRGGIALVGWSLGTVTAHAFLAHLDTLPTSTINRLAPYIRTVLLHDTFATAVGFPNPPEFDTSIGYIVDPNERFAAFQTWITSYFDSTDINPATGNVDTLDYNDANPSKPNTFTNAPSWILNPMLNEAAYAGSETIALIMSQTSYIELIRRALFDTTIASLLPNVKARYFYGGETSGILIIANWDLTEASPSYYGGVSARNIALHYATTGNHFVFWDAPEFAIQQYLTAINL